MSVKRLFFYGIFRLDIWAQKRVSYGVWKIEVNNYYYLGVDVPQEVDLYSLVQGRTELILFGGLKRDISIRGAPPNHSTRDSSSVTNNIHILYPYIDKI